MSRRWMLPLAAVAVVATLSGCVLFGSDNPLPTATVDTPEVPASLSQTQPIVYVGLDLLPATDDAPAAIGGSQQTPGEAPVPVVWTSTDDATWTAQEVDPGFEGAFTGALGGDDTLSAIAGTVWRDGKISTALWTSKDRASWKRVDLPDEFASRYRLSVFDVSDGRVLVIGADVDGTLAAVLVTGTDAEMIDLPQPAKGKQLSPYSIVWGDDDDLVLLAEVATEGSSGDIVAYTSSTAGEKWSKPSAVIGDSDFVSGMTWTGAVYVVTGGTRASADPGAAYVPSAWSSPDGKTWTAESVPNPSSVETAFDTSDAWLGAPGSGPNGDVAALGPNEASSHSAVFYRTADGTWQYVTDTSVNEGNGMAGLAVPLADGRILATVGTTGGVRTGIAGGGWVDGTRLSTLAPENIVTDVQDTADGALLTLSRPTFTVTDDGGWTNSSVASQALVTPKDAVSDSPWDPAEVASLITVTGGISDAGQVVLGSDFSNVDVIIARGFFRADADSPWTPVTGFPTSGALNFYSVKRIGDEWIAAGTIRANSEQATPAHGTVWSSPDGVTWTQVAGDFGSGALETSVADVCEFEGEPIAIGWVESDSARYTLRAWSPTDGTWTPVDVGTFDDSPGYGTGCTEGDDGLIVSAYFGGRSVLLLHEGTSWKRVFQAGRGDVLSTPVAVPGGFAAAGATSDDTHSQPVVWLSADGTAWSPVVVPSYQDGVTSQVALLGDDLVVTMSPVTGPAVSIVRDITKVVEQYAK